MDRRLSAYLNVESNDSQIRQHLALIGEYSIWGKEATGQLLGILQPQGISDRESIQKDGLIAAKGKVTNLRSTLKNELRLMYPYVCLPKSLSSSDTRRVTPYSESKGIIYDQRKDKKNRLMRIDELHKFSDGTLDDVRSALNDRLKGIRMEYLPETFWNHRDKAKMKEHDPGD
ncbi:hypothetical protein Tco_1217944 [Tanacetum coccineum]